MRLRPLFLAAALLAAALPAPAQPASGPVSSVVARQWAGVVHDFYRDPKADPSALLPIIQAVRAVPPGDTFVLRSLAPVKAELIRAAGDLAAQAVEPKAGEDGLLKTGEKSTALLLGFSNLLNVEERREFEEASLKASSRLNEERRRRLISYVTWMGHALGAPVDDSLVCASSPSGSRKIAAKLRPAPHIPGTDVPAVSERSVAPPTLDAVVIAPGASTRWWDQFRESLLGRGPPPGYVPRRPSRVKLPPGLKLQTVAMRENYRGEEKGDGVVYLKPWELQNYQLEIRRGKVYGPDGKLYSTPLDGPKEIAVMDAQGNFYAGRQKLFRFHHSSFTGGQPVAYAGEIEIVDGEIVFLSRVSGHYRPSAKIMKQMLAVLSYNGVDTKTIRRDDW